MDTAQNLFLYSNKAISEIAYDLEYQYLQYFSRSLKSGRIYSESISNDR